MRWNSEAEAREQIKELVAAYYNDFRKPEQGKPFAPGDRLPYASRVYDEKEMCGRGAGFLADHRTLFRAV